jgi:L-fuconolactonase
MQTPIIDSHQHFWDPESGGDYAWLNGPFQPINRVFAPDDLRLSLQNNNIQGTILVQTWNDLGETWEFLRIAETTDFIAGVVGWVDLTDPDVGSTLAKLQASPFGKWLVGIRHLIQTESDPNWLMREDVRRGLRSVQDAGLVYDLVPNLPQLPAVIRTVEDFQDMRFVLDHIAKPNIKNGEFDDWADLMRGFENQRHHVWCKLSGMITEADWQTWEASDLKPYVARVLEIFGTDRCMFGSDWPVCLVAGSYNRMLAGLRNCLTELTQSERNQVFGASAIEAYRLPSFQPPLSK